MSGRKALLEFIILVAIILSQIQTPKINLGGMHAHDDLGDVVARLLWYVYAAHISHHGGLVEANKFPLECPPFHIWPQVLK